MTATLGQPPLDVDKPSDEDSQLWSVTTVIDVLHKEGIVYWAAEQAANCAIESTATWQAMLGDEGHDAAAKWIRDARFRLPKTRLSDTKLGTVVHKVCETYALTGEKPGKDFAADLVTREGGPQVDVDAETTLIGVMLNHFDTWLQQFTPAYQAAEMVVFSPLYGYAGQLDAMMTVDLKDGGGPVRFLADYKSTRKPLDGQGRPKRPYKEQNALQLAAYRYAELAAIRFRPRRTERYRRRYYLLSQAEIEQAQPVPEVDTGLVLQITPDGCDAFPTQCGHREHFYFLNCLEIMRWLNQDSRDAQGDPLVAGGN